MLCSSEGGHGVRPTLKDWGGTPHLLEVNIYTDYLEISYMGDSSLLHGLLESIILQIDGYTLGCNPIPFCFLAHIGPFGHRELLHWPLCPLDVTPQFLGRHFPTFWHYKIPYRYLVYVLPAPVLKSDIS